ncbi:MAG TPA: PaaI family thioesterase [Polyangia bacterium]
MNERAFQDFYPDDCAVCYGCGRLNPLGLHVRSFWEGEESVCSFEPRAEHTAVAGFVYGGLIASLIDCHGTGTAAAAAYRAENRALDSLPAFRFVTASLHVDYRRPTPLGPSLMLRGRVVELKGRKVVVAIRLTAAGELCAEGTVIAVQIPESMLAKL